MGKKITFRRFRICENMWWTRYREALTHWQIQNVKFDLWMKKDKPIVCLLMTWTNVEFWWKMYVHTSNYNELMGSNHQITNLVFPKFFHSFFLIWAVEKENKLLIGPKQFSFFSLKCKIWTQIVVESFTKKIRDVKNYYFFISKIYVFSILGFHQCPSLVSKSARRCNDVRSRSNYHVQTSWKSSHTKQSCRIFWRTVSKLS